MRHFRLLVPVLVLMAGCQASVEEGGVAGSSLQADYRAIAKGFGESVLSNDWGAAYAMTTAKFRSKVTQEQMRAGYEDLLKQIHEDDPQFLPNAVETDLGKLPDDEADAKSGYGIENPPPKGTWKAWAFAGIGFKPEGGGAIERGIDALLLVVEDEGERKIAWVDWEFMD